MTSPEGDVATSDNVTNLAEVRRSKAALQSNINPKHKNRKFDAEKVERLKAAIADGSYVVDSLSVADKFIEHERH